MKKIYLGIFTVAALLGSCQAEAELATPSISTPVVKTTLTAAVSQTTKVYFDNTDESGAITLSWQESDSFTLYDAAGNRVCDFEYAGENGAQSGAFTGESSVELIDGATYTAVIPASTAATLGEREAEYSIASQNITDIDALDHLNGAVRLSVEFEYSNNATLAFEHEVSLIMVSVEMDEGVVPTQVEVYDAANAMTYTATLPSDMASSFTTYIAVEAVAVEDARDITFTVTDSNEVTYTETKSSAVSLEAGTYYSASLSFLSPVGENVYKWSYGWTQDGAYLSADDNDGVFYLSNVSTTANNWNTQFCIEFGGTDDWVTFESISDDDLGCIYKIVLDAKIEGESIDQCINLNMDDAYLTWTTAWFAPTEDWATHEMTFTVEDDHIGGNRLTISFSDKISALYLKNIAVYKIAPEAVE